MTAEEIREHVKKLAEWEQNGTYDGKPFSFEAAKTGALWEIAAQLAELNRNLKPRSPLEQQMIAGGFMRGA